MFLLVMMAILTKPIQHYGRTRFRDFVYYHWLSLDNAFIYGFFTLPVIANAFLALIFLAKLTQEGIYFGFKRVHAIHYVLMCLVQ